MNDFINFLRLHWHIIAEFVGFLIIVFISIFKRKIYFNKTDSIKKDILCILPTLINLVERPGCGSDKLNEVLLLCKKYIVNKYKLDDFSSFNDFVIEQIENILKTPTKK